MKEQTLVSDVCAQCFWQPENDGTALGTLDRTDGQTTSDCHCDILTSIMQHGILSSTCFLRCGGRLA